MFKWQKQQQNYTSKLMLQTSEFIALLQTSKVKTKGQDFCKTIAILSYCS